MQTGGQVLNSKYVGGTFQERSHGTNAQYYVSGGHSNRWSFAGSVYRYHGSIHDVWNTKRENWAELIQSHIYMSHGRSKREGGLCPCLHILEYLKSPIFYSLHPISNMHPSQLLLGIVASATVAVGLTIPIGPLVSSLSSRIPQPLSTCTYASSSDKN